MSDKKEKDKPGKPINPKNLPRQIVFFVVLAIIAGAGAFLLVNRFAPKTESMYDKFRTTATILSALTIGGAAVVQYRKQRVTEEQAESDRIDRENKQRIAEAQQRVIEAQAKLDRDVRYGERLTKAIEHLGDDSITIRKGAIYELKRLAIDSEKDQESVVNILASFVREKIVELSDEQKQKIANGEKPDEQPRPRSDVFEASYALAFLHEKYKELSEIKLVSGTIHDLLLEDAQLERIWLKDATFPDANLKGANLCGAHFEGANLLTANLENARLFEAHLEGARLSGAHLENAVFAGAHLEDAFLVGAYLTDAHLVGAHLTGVKLMVAHLERAFLGRANLNGAELNGSNLEGAILLNTRLKGTTFSNANLEGANLCRAKNLTAEQLCHAHLDKTTRMDDNLREELRKMGKDV